MATGARREFDQKSSSSRTRSKNEPTGQRETAVLMSHRPTDRLLPVCAGRDIALADAFLKGWTHSFCKSRTHPLPPARLFRCDGTIRNSISRRTCTRLIPFLGHHHVETNRRHRPSAHGLRTIGTRTDASRKATADLRWPSRSRVSPDGNLGTQPT